MIELYLSKVTETSETEQAGKLYARVSYKQTMSVQDMAHHMAEHNTMFSEGSITGILIDFVKCVREMVLMGNTVKIDNLAIFKATVEANALETLYDAEQDKVAQATIGSLATGAKTGAAVKTVKLLAQSTGEFTREELRKDVRLSWSDKARAEIQAAKNGNMSAGTNTGGGSNSGSNTGGSQSGSGESGVAGNYRLVIYKYGSGTSTVTDDSEQELPNDSSVASGSNVNISVVPVEGKEPIAKVNGNRITLTENDGTYTGSFVMPTKGTVLEINSEPSDIDFGDEY